MFMARPERLRITSLQSALRAALRAFKFVPDKFVKLPDHGREFSS